MHRCSRVPKFLGDQNINGEILRNIGLAILATFDPADRFFLFHASQLALADKPAFAADGAQYTTLNDLFTEALE
jgi:hypothetical protein